jgi:hypothetical protein
VGAANRILLAHEQDVPPLRLAKSSTWSRRQPMPYVTELSASSTKSRIHAVSPRATTNSSRASPLSSFSLQFASGSGLSIRPNTLAALTVPPRGFLLGLRTIGQARAARAPFGAPSVRGAQECRNRPVIETDGVARMLRATTSYCSMAGPSARRTVEARSGLAASAGLRQLGGSRSVKSLRSSSASGVLSAQGDLVEEGVSGSAKAVLRVARNRDEP